MANRKNFLSVPTKPSSDVDIASRVNSYMQTCMSLNAEVQTAVKEGLDELNRLRRNAFMNDEAGKTLSSVEAMHKYYDSFASLDEKIPIRDGECPIPFRWKSAFDKGGLFGGKRDLTHNYGSYEKACVLFNIAAYQAKYVTHQPLQNDEELRQAVGYFKSSANIFEFLKNEVMHFIPDEVPKDMQPQLLNALSQLMLTQANEIMYHKAVKDKNSPAILKAVAMQISDLYGQVYKLLNYEQARGVVDKSWYATIQAKDFAFHAYAVRHHIEEIEGQKYDSVEERLGRVREVVEFFEKAADLLPRVFDQDLADAKNAQEKLDKDNNLIYHSRIPIRTELKALPRKLILNVSAPKFPLTKDFRDLFTELVSASVSKAVNFFQGQLKERVHILVSDLRTSDNAIKAGLASINMPALIEDEIKQERLPASIVKKSDEIRSKGGFHAVEQREKELLKVSEETAQLINKIKEKIDQEELADDAMRDHYGARWTVTPSQQLNSKFKQEVGKYLGIDKTAQSANEKVRSKIRLCERDVMVMTGPREGLLERVPPIQAAASDQSQAVEKLRELWTCMEKEIVQVNKFEERLNNTKFDPTNQFLEILKREGQLEDPQIQEFTQKTLDDLFKQIVPELGTNKELRNALLEEMKVWHQKFTQGSTSGEDERSKALKQLTAAYDVFLECQGNLEEGAKFYIDLKALLTRLQQQLDDYSFARQTEREDLLQQVEPQIAPSVLIPQRIAELQKKRGGTGDTSGRAPPPRPPPPGAPGAAGPHVPPATTPYTPDIGQINLNPAPPQPNAPPQIPPRQGQHPPLPPAHQPYQPNLGYPQQQPYGQYQNPYSHYTGYNQQPQYGNPQVFQPVPHLPFYGAFQNEAGGHQTQQYATPYPQQYPASHPQPPQYQQYPPPPQPQQPTQQNTNPFT